MRFFVLLITVACVPLLAAVHERYFTRWQRPQLENAMVKQLADLGVNEATAAADHLDLMVSGTVADPDVLDLAETWLESHAAPFRLVKNDLFVAARLEASQEKEILNLAGWLPDEKHRRQVLAAAAGMRPDLKIVATGLKTHPQVRMPAGVSEALTVEHPWVAEALADFKRAPWLEIRRTEGRTLIAGLLPEGAASLFLHRQASVAHVISGLKTSPHVKDSAWTKAVALEPLLTGFFGPPGDRTLSVDETAKAHFSGTATPSLARQWQEQAAKVFGGEVEWELNLHPSAWHFPGRKVESRLPETVLVPLQQSLENLRICFKPDSDRLSPEDRARLAALTSSLLTAGPALKLVIGGYPDSEEGKSGQMLAEQRARAVHTFLIEHGLPSGDVTVTAFDALSGNQDKAASCVEILIR